MKTLLNVVGGYAGVAITYILGLSITFLTIKAVIALFVLIFL